MQASSNAAQLSREEVAQYTQNKSQLYDAMVANGWIMPAKKNSFVTLNVIKLIRQKKLWVPHVTEIYRLPVCARPPPCQQILDEIQETVGDWVRQDLGEDPTHTEMLQTKVAMLEQAQKRMPDQRFLLIALKAVAPEHEFFQKGYAYYRPANPNSIKNLKLMDNSDGLYDGLPRLPAHIYECLDEN